MAASRWTASAPLISPSSDASHEIVAVKDPSVVFHEGRWHVFATVADAKGGWNMCYLNFSSWESAASDAWTYLDSNPALRGYHCAPQVFYFRPQKKWYLLFQSGQPQYSTSETLDKPGSWSAPQDFFKGVPESVVDKSWLDFWLIAESQFMYLFFTGDNGKFYRSRTKLSDFPKGMSKPEIVLDLKKEDLYEGAHIYKLKGKKGYICLAEAVGPNWNRYYKTFSADSLDGAWKDQGNTFEKPFAGIHNTAFAKGVQPWTVDISHGELLRDGVDERMIVDPKKLRFLFQGRDPKSDGWDYQKLPYRLGLLREN